MQIKMLQDPISKPPSVQMQEISRGTGADHSRRNKANGGASEQVLKCPRCDSLNTKFCYYNNYSLTQPRHFCKNCRRYWTEGGSLRNVPIGGGCRKNKRVKQRSVDPQLFGSLADVDHHSSFMQHAGAGPGSFLSSSCFVGGPSTVPGFLDFVNPSSDSHLLSMAFSQIQESLRHSTIHDQQPPIKQLALMQQPRYDDAGVHHVSNSLYVKPEHHLHHLQQQIFNGSDQLGGNLFEHPATSGAHDVGNSSLSTLAEHQRLCNNFGVQDHGTGGGPFSLAAASQTAHLAASAGSQLKLVQQQQQQQALALHLCASDHQRQILDPPPGCSSTGRSGINIEDDCAGTVRSVHNYPSHIPAERYNDFHHRHLALPDFEDQESPESMNSMSMSMMMRSGDNIYAPAKLARGPTLNNKERNNILVGADRECWQQQQAASAHILTNDQLHADQLQFATAPSKELAVQDGPPSNSAGAAAAASCSDHHAAEAEQHEAVHTSFWSPSPSPWTTNQDAHTSALL